MYKLWVTNLKILLWATENVVVAFDVLKYVGEVSSRFVTFFLYSLKGKRMATDIDMKL